MSVEKRLTPDEVQMFQFWFKVQLSGYLSIR